jgi:hypothetical protein
LVTGEELFASETGRGDWDLLQPSTRASWDARARGERPFIAPEPRSNDTCLCSQLGLEPECPDHGEHVDPDPGVTVPCRDALPEEIPGGAQQVINRATKHGWDVRTTFAQGPHYDEHGKYVGQVDSIAVRASRDGRRFAATWIRKPWTKAGSSGTFEFQGAHIWPRHLEGGMHDSTTLTAYTKGA